MGRMATGKLTCGVWQHAKGHHYLVLGIAADANNDNPRDEEQVVYVSLEGWGLPGSRMRYRKVSEFLERFTPVAEEPSAVGLANAAIREAFARE